MTVFSTDELAGLRLAQEGHMPDTCQVGARSTSPDAFGELIDTFTYGLPTACGVGPSRTFINETATTDGTVVTTDRELRLPAGTVVVADSRVKVTHRFGVELATPEVYEVQGNPYEGPSGIVANLRRVDT